MTPTNTPAESVDLPMPQGTTETPESDPPLAETHMKSVSALVRERFGLGR